MARGLLLILLSLLHLGICAPGAGEGIQLVVGRAYSYSYLYACSAKDNEGGAARGAGRGQGQVVQLKATVLVLGREPGDGFLCRLELTDVSAGASEQPSWQGQSGQGGEAAGGQAGGLDWSSLLSNDAFFLWSEHGHVGEFWHSAEDTVWAVNAKRGVLGALSSTISQEGSYSAEEVTFPRSLPLPSLLSPPSLSETFSLASSLLPPIPFCPYLLSPPQ